MIAEWELAKFLDKHLYSEDIFSKAQRTDDSIPQLQGSDIVVSIPNLKIINSITS